MNPFQGGWLVLVTVIATMILAEVRLPVGPDWLVWLRPDWAMAVFFFWGVTAPKRVGVVSAWIVGLFFDSLLAHPLGVNGVCLACATYVAKRYHDRLSLYTVFQQFAVVLGIAALVQFVKHSVVVVVFDADWTVLAIVGPTLTTALVYPPLALALGELARRVGME